MTTLAAVETLNWPMFDLELPPGLLIFGGGGVAAGVCEAWGFAVTVLQRKECDVTNAAEVKSAIEAHEAGWIVCCAGVSDPSDYRREVEVNLIGSLNVAVHSSVPTVLIASVAGLYGKPGHVGYSASKAGVISVVQSLAAEGKEIWALSPGRVDTPMRQRDYPSDTPGSRLAPVQVGQAVVDILRHRLYEPGTNVVLMKRGLDTVIVREHKGDGWKEELRIGLPVTI